MLNQKNNSGPSIFVHSNHPLVLRTIRKILAVGPYVVRPFSQTALRDAESGWILILDTCSVGDWLKTAIQSHRRNARSIVIAPDNLQDLQEELRLVYLGVRGVVPVPSLENELAPAIDSVMDGRMWFRSRTLHEYVLRTNSWGNRVGNGFTTREEQIIAFLTKGSSNKEIGNILGISDRTVKFHVSNILRKFKLKNRRGLRREPVAAVAVSPWRETLNVLPGDNLAGREP